MPTLKFGIIYVKKENILLNRSKRVATETMFSGEMWKC